ncbi:MAG: AAA family ATPase, partial [Sphingomonas sp.]
MKKDNFVIISGCSGGGKSSLVEALGARGHAIVPEPGRRIVRDELATGGTALPWVDMAGFAARAVEMALTDRAGARRLPGWVFFDRGLIDAAIALEHATGEAVAARISRKHRYLDTVFLAPPWPELYETDDERRAPLAEAIAEYDRLAATYPSLGYAVIELPRVSISERADFV